jgi:hypothetical protein
MKRIGAVAAELIIAAWQRVGIVSDSIAQNSFTYRLPPEGIVP